MDLTAVADSVTTVLDVGSSIVGCSSLLAALLPKASTNAIAIYKIVRKIVDFIGANWINAKNGE